MIDSDAQVEETSRTEVLGAMYTGRAPGLFSSEFRAALTWSTWRES